MRLDFSFLTGFGIMNDVVHTTNLKYEPTSFGERKMCEE